MLSLGQRLQTILQENKILKKEFASELGISANYVSILVNDRQKSISEPLAKLIEETYGYSAQWILTGTGEKLSGKKLTSEKAKIIKSVRKMTDSEAKAVLAFINTLSSINEKGE